MGTLKSGNEYYDSAVKKIEEGKENRAVSLLEDAARDYMDVLEDAESRRKDMVEGKINDCIYTIRKLNSPEEEKIHGEGGKEVSYELNSEIPDKDFSDVAGMSGLKKRMKDAIIDPLVHPESMKFTDDPSRGIVMYGPPGCGKTYIAKATAGEASKESGEDVQLYYVRASDLVRSKVGETEQNIKKLFEGATEDAPSIIFLDELDSLGMSRSSDSDYAHRFLTEILQDFDIVSDEQVLVLAATNYPSVIDPALLRPGRFDDKILVGPPDLEARVELFNLYTQDKPVEKGIQLKQFSVRTQDYSAADIRKVCNEGGRMAKKDFLNGQENRKISKSDLERAVDEVKPSIYFWVDETEKLIKENKIPAAFERELTDIVEDVNARRYQGEDGSGRSSGPSLSDL